MITVTFICVFTKIMYNFNRIDIKAHGRVERVLSINESSLFTIFEYKY